MLTRPHRGIECIRKGKVLAVLNVLHWSAMRPVVADGRVEWKEETGARELPVIFQRTGETWSEANLWARHLAAHNHAKTVRRSVDHLCAYATWLEEENLTWWHFPPFEKDRCLVRYRGALKQARDRGELAPSTTSHRMAAVIRFYRWASSVKLISPDWPMWIDRIVGIRLENQFGLQHTLSVQSTNLAIPNRKVAGAFLLEDGLMPVSSNEMQQILKLADQFASQELALMLRLGFGTGMRLGSICELKLRTFENAQRCPILGDAGWWRLSIGPSARPPVPTKFGVSGSVLIPFDLLELARDYVHNTRRLKREAQADEENRALLLLTRFGKPYAGQDSRAVNVEMSRLRRAGIAEGVDVMRDFHFHRSRATFLTQLMRAALSCLPVADAVDFVREVALHKDSSTTLKYVKFVETTKAMGTAANAFTEAFMGSQMDPKNA